MTTNPPEATGDGVAMALRAGVPVADVEFVQFHPTALHHPAMPRPLLSEALRGHGRCSATRRGERFVDELAPRDVVSRAMAARMAARGGRPPLARRHRARAVRRAVPDHRRVARRGRAGPGGRLAADRPGRPPPLAAAWSPTSSGRPPCRACGRPARSPAPASTGPTGWRRTRCSRGWSSGPGWPSRAGGVDGPAADRGHAGRPRRTASRRDPRPARGRGRRRSPRSRARPPTARARLGRPRRRCGTACRRAMTAGAGVVRSAARSTPPRRPLAELADGVAAVGRARRRGGRRAAQPAARWPAALLVSAGPREESRGAHTRADFPATDPRWRCRLVHAAPGRARLDRRSRCRRSPTPTRRSTRCRRAVAARSPRTWRRSAT